MSQARRKARLGKLSKEAREKNNSKVSRSGDFPETLEMDRRRAARLQEDRARHGLAASDPEWEDFSSGSEYSESDDDFDDDVPWTHGPGGSTPEYNASLNPRLHTFGLVAQHMQALYVKGDVASAQQVFDQAIQSQTLSTAEKARLSRLLSSMGDGSLMQAQGGGHFQQAALRSGPIELLLVALMVYLLHQYLGEMGSAGGFTVLLPGGPYATGSVSPAGPAPAPTYIDVELRGAAMTALLFCLPEHWHLSYQLMRVNKDDAPYVISPRGVGVACMIFEALRFFTPQVWTFLAVSVVAQVSHGYWSLLMYSAVWVAVVCLQVVFLVVRFVKANPFTTDDLGPPPSDCSCLDCRRIYNLLPLDLRLYRAKNAGVSRSLGGTAYFAGAVGPSTKIVSQLVGGNVRRAVSGQFWLFRQIADCLGTALFVVVVCLTLVRFPIDSGLLLPFF